MQPMCWTAISVCSNVTPVLNDANRPPEFCAQIVRGPFADRPHGAALASGHRTGHVCSKVAMLKPPEPTPKKEIIA